MTTEAGVRLVIEYHRVRPSDATGMVNIDCDQFHYADIGSHHGAQVVEGVSEADVLAFGAKLSKLVKEHFGAVEPMLKT